MCIVKFLQIYSCACTMIGQGWMLMNQWSLLVRTERYKQGLTSVKLAKKAGISQAHLSRIERGLVRNPSPDIVERIENALGTQLSSHVDSNPDFRTDKVVDAIASLLEALPVSEAARQSILMTLHSKLKAEPDER